MEDTVSLVPIGSDSSGHRLAMSMVTSDMKANINLMVECKELMMCYACAMREAQSRFDVLNIEYGVRHRRNPIQSISTRLKGSASIVEKLERKGLTVTPEHIETHILDVAGVRVICCYIDDIFALAEAVSHQDGVEVLAMKDYITAPKPNGYRSLHLILGIPVSFERQTKRIPVEVQIRTIAMDFWASLEHQIKYKREIEQTESIVAQLRECAETIAETDEKMLRIRRQIEACSLQSEDDLLLEKLKKIDRPLE